MKIDARQHRSLRLFQAGYAFTLWVVSATSVVSRHLLGEPQSAFAFLAGMLLLPVLIVVLGAEGFTHLDERARVALNGHLRRGQVSRKTLFKWGVVTGLFTVIGGLVLLGGALALDLGWWVLCAAAVCAWLFVAIFPASMFHKCSEKVTGRKFPAPKSVLSDYFSCSKDTARTPAAPPPPALLDDELDWMQMQREERLGDPEEKS